MIYFTRTNAEDEYIYAFLIHARAVNRVELVTTAFDTILICRNMDILDKTIEWLKKFGWEVSEPLPISYLSGLTVELIGVA